MYVFRSSSWSLVPRHEQISYDYEGKYSKNQTLMDKAKDTVEGIYNKEAKDKVGKGES